ncbi:MAG: hypothetical protein MdMp014T_2612 [Treponematales bacterium]
MTRGTEYTPLVPALEPRPARETATLRLVTNLPAPSIFHNPLSTIHYPPAPRSPLPVPRSPFPAPRSPLPVPFSTFLPGAL